MKNDEILYSGAIRCDGDIVYITKVIYEFPRVTICWSDGTTTESTCAEADAKMFTKEEGLRIALLKKLIPVDQMKHIYEEWLPHDGRKEREAFTITLKEVRSKHKQKAAIKKQKAKDKRIREAINFLKLEGVIVARS